jgi:hypothetical protein
MLVISDIRKLSHDRQRALVEAVYDYHSQFRTEG